MKQIKFLIVFAAFLIMVASVFNLLNTSSEDRIGIYLELVVMAILTVVVVLINNYERKLKK
ncbi:MAG: hypothetical protein N4A49_00870 [Marinifilaceae bacterium]|jgi:divalent metal cation (Fe/Co/Zn/Cd) transporter|nr:hypothetical protein [Marinifilaceae bacterium]